MTQPAKSQEPSMEEILASIRRIIADDDATKSTPPAEPAKAAPPPQAAPVPPPAPRPPAAALRVAPPEPSLPEADEASSDAANAGAATDHSSSDILDLTESMAAPMSPPPVSSSPMSDAAPQFRTIDGNFDVSYEEAAERPAPQRHGDGGERAQLMSRETSAAVDSAFNTLAQTVLVQNARTLEDLVREMLRPMLKSWLDDNLPGMVERLVRAEIERVSRGRLG
jgi:cell pole-organizing protein PopZ